MLDIRTEEAEVLSLVRRFFALWRREAAHSVETALLHEILKEIRHMSDNFGNELTRLQADVSAQGTVIASATTAFQGLAAQLAAAEEAARNAGATDAQIASVAAVRQGLESNTAALAAAIPANTPAAPGGQASSAAPVLNPGISAAAGPNAPTAHTSAASTPAPTGP